MLLSSFSTYTEANRDRAIREGARKVLGWIVGAYAANKVVDTIDESIVDPLRDAGTKVYETIGSAAKIVYNHFRYVPCSNCLC